MSGAAVRNVLLLLPQGVETNSGNHARLFARRLVEADLEPVLLVPDASGAAGMGGALREHREGGRADLFGDGSPADVIHAWTPREVVRRCWENIRAAHPGSRLVIHLEDNEAHLAAARLGTPWPELEGWPMTRLDARVPGDIMHPRRGPRWLAAADGVSWVVPALDAFNAAGRPALELIPLVDEGLFHPRPVNLTLRRRLGIPDWHTVLVYTGNVHAANAEEVSVLYRAVAALNAGGCPATLLRTGRGPAPGTPGFPAAHVTHLGWVRRALLPEVLAAADVFVQPGEPGDFNDCRLPCKLPEFFALGRPVILPRSNLGLVLRHGEEAWVLPRADVAGITEAVRMLRERPALAERLAGQAIEVYLRRLAVPDLGDRARGFYEALAPGRRAAASD